MASRWLFGDETTELVRPGSFETREVQVLKAEKMFGMMPLSFATYPAIALRLPGCDVERLKRSLSKALELVPSAAGRLRDDGDILELNGAGVPFTTVKSSEASAPERIEERQLIDFATFHRPRSVRNGQSPLISVKLTLYQDESAILGFSRSHVLFDGSSAWTFLNLWAGLARDDSVKEPIWSKAQVEQEIPKGDELLSLAKRAGVDVSPSFMNTVMKSLIPVVGFVWDTFFIHFGVSLTRHHLFFSNEELALLKEAATPKEVAAGQDNWVTTQEAICAFMLLAIGRHCLKKTSSGRVQMMFLLDSRKAMKFASNQIMGNGLTFSSIFIDSQDVLAMDLPQLASHLHQSLSAQGTSDQRDLWRMTSGACELGTEHSVLRKVHSPENVDLKFAVNNSSKRLLPDFGKGHCESVITNAGPTIFLPAKGGMDVHLHPSVFSGCGQAQVQAALKALRELPKAE